MSHASEFGRRRSHARSVPAAAHGPAVAAFMLFIVCGLSILEGVSAELDHRPGPDADRLGQFDTASWGWVHIAVGVAVAIAAWRVLAGRRPARPGALVVVACSVVGNLLWLPYYPVWSFLVLGLDGTALALLGTLEKGPRERGPE
jgi:hypothetical protein